MNNRDYWRKRFEELENANNYEAQKILYKIQKEYLKADAELQKQISLWYTRFAKNNNITISEARKLLNSKELEEFKWDVNQYIENCKENAITGEFTKQLENASAKVHITRFESLKTQIQMSIEKMFGNNLDLLDTLMKKTYLGTYYHTAFEIQKGIGIGWDIAGVNEKALQKVITRPWATDGQCFSDRIWKEKKEIVNKLQKQLTQNILLGKAPDDSIKSISKTLNVSKSNAGRLVMTESSYISSLAQKDCYNELDIEQYEVIGTLDGITCEVCGSMDKKVFYQKDFEAGVTANPFHPRCRCCTAPYFESGKGVRIARDVKTGETYYVPSDMNYEEWKARQDEKYGAGTVDNVREMSYNETKDKEQYDRYKSVLGDYAPKTFEDFQNIKHNNNYTYSDLKHKYRVINQYKFDSGNLTPTEIYELDQRIFSEKRDNFSSKYKKSGNIAGAYLNNDKNTLYLAHSLINNTKGIKKYKGKNNVIILSDNRKFKYIDLIKSNGDIRNETFYDTEAKLFEYFSSKTKNDCIKSITMLSERGMCESCQGVMAQFKEKYPNITVNVISNKRTEGDVWKHRRR